MTVWRLVIIGYASVALAGLSAVLPRDSAARWPWAGGGLALTLVNALISVAELRKMRAAGGRSVQHPFLALAQILAFMAAWGMFNYAFGGHLGLYRSTLLVSLLVAALIGDRLIFTASGVFCLVVLTLSVAAQGMPLRTLPGAVAAEAAVWVGVAFMFRHLGSRVEEGSRTNEALAALAAAAARSEDLVVGLEQSLRLAAKLLGRSRIVAFSSGQDGRARVLAAWPDLSPEDTEVMAASGFGQAVRSKEPVWTATSAFIPIAPIREPEGEMVVLVVQHEVVSPTETMRFRFAVERIVVPLGILVERTRYISRLQGLTVTDGLTGLANRRALLERLELDLASARRREQPLCVVMMDIDHFKLYNDSFGHLAGDDALRELAGVLASRFRSTDFVARYGGEEFCAVLPDTAARPAAALLGELHALVREIPLARTLTFSAGVAQWDGREEMEALLGRADSALYLAKAGGRDRTETDDAQAA